MSRTIKIVALLAAIAVLTSLGLPGARPPRGPEEATPAGAGALATAVVTVTPGGDSDGPYLTTQKPAVEIQTPPVQGKLYGGPYVTEVTPTSAVLNWVLRGSGAPPPDTGWRVQHARVKGLKPLTTYYYDVLRDGTAEGRGQFTTPPASSGDFSFAVYGDTRTRHDVHRMVAGKMAERSPDFAIHTGDLVSKGLEANQWPTFLECSQALLRKASFYPALGNHERNSPLFFQFLSLIHI